MALDEFKLVPIPADGDSAVVAGPETRCRDEEGTIFCEWVAGMLDSPRIPKSQMFTSLGDGGGYATFVFSKGADGVNRLRRIEVRSNMDYLDGMLPPMTQKFGEPTVSTREVQNAYGATFESSTYLWRNEESTIELTTRCERVTLICLTYSHTELESLEAERERTRKGDPTTRL